MSSFNHVHTSQCVVQSELFHKLNDHLMKTLPYITRDTKYIMKNTVVLYLTKGDHTSNKFIHTHMTVGKVSIQTHTCFTDK